MQIMEGGAHSVEGIKFAKLIRKSSAYSLWLGEEEKCGGKLSVAVYSKKYLTDTCQMNSVYNLVYTMSSMYCPFIARFYGSLENEQNIYLLFEELSEKNLEELVLVKGPVQERDSAKYFCQMASILEYFLQTRHETAARFVASNFYFDKFMNIRYIDLEFPDRNTKSITASDNFASLGALLYFMNSGKFVAHLGLSSENLTASQLPVSFSTSLSDIVQKLLSKDPQTTLDKIRKHPYFSPSQYSALSRILYPPSHHIQKASIDEIIVQKLESYGIDCSSLPEMLGGFEQNQATRAYFILQQVGFVEQMKAVIEGEAGSTQGRRRPSLDSDIAMASLNSSSSIGEQAITLKSKKREASVPLLLVNVEPEKPTRPVPPFAKNVPIPITARRSVRMKSFSMRGSQTISNRFEYM